MITDRMRINHADGESLPDYGSLYLVKFNKLTRVNDYGGSNTDDVSKLDLITNASAGSTCLYANGDIYRRELDGWVKFGAAAGNGAAGSSASNTSLNLSPLDIDRAALTKDVSFDENEESTLEAQKSAVTSSTGDEVRGDDK